MKKSLICLLVLIISLFSICSVFGEAIDVTYPQQVNQGEEFNVNLVLNNFSQDIYDIKIDILENGNRISRILDGDSWQSTNYYVNDIIDTSVSNEHNFRINITENYNGSADIEIKVRNSKNAVKNFSGYKIDINPKIYNPPQNNSQNNTNQNNTNNQEEISLSLNWDEEDIVNGDEFNIEVKAENLEDEDYDVKVWIEDDDGNAITDRYDEENNEWKSGTYFITGLLTGSGEDSKKVKLRIRNEYSDFSGDAEIHFKLRSGEETNDNIEILEKDETSDNPNNNEVTNKNKTEETKITSQSSSSITGEVIKLGGLESKEQKKDNLIYNSNNEKIKIYAIIGFAVLCLGLVLLIIFKKIK